MRIADLGLWLVFPGPLFVVSDNLSRIGKYRLERRKVCMNIGYPQTSHTTPQLPAKSRGPETCGFGRDNQ